MGALSELAKQRKEAEEKKQEKPSALRELAAKRREETAVKNAGGGFGAGLGYVAGRIGTDAMGVVEGITDYMAARGDLRLLNLKKAEQRFTNSFALFDRRTHLFQLILYYTIHLTF